MRTPLCVLVAAATVDIAAAQQTILVGAGQPFATIPPAIAAASPGDTVLVLAGTYTQPLDIDKGIRLVGRGAILQISVFPATPALTVHDVPANETFAMSGFDLVPGTSGGASLGMQLRDCAGPVALRELSGSSGQRWSIAAARMQQLHIAASFVFGVRATDSHVVCEQCLTEPTVGSGMTLDDGTLVIVGCTVRGGNGGLLPGPAATLLAGTLVATRSELLSFGSGLPAITTTSGALLLDPSTVLLPSGAAPAVAGPVAPIVAEVASVAARSNGTLLTVDSHGAAGAWFANALSLAVPQVLTPIGLCWLDTGSALVFDLATYDPITRQHTRALNHPPLPAGLVFAVQSVHFAAGTPAFGSPALVTVP